MSTSHPGPASRSLSTTATRRPVVGSAELSRRSFLSSLALTASGLLVPEWIIDPPKGRSMVSVPGMPFNTGYRVTESIGSAGRDFSTWQTWEDAIPADLVAGDVQHVGEGYTLAATEVRP